MWFRSFLLLLLVSICSRQLTAEPAFPTLFHSGVSTRSQYRIQSELIPQSGSPEVLVEVGDLRRGRSAVVSKTLGGPHRVHYCQVTPALIYDYEPFKCQLKSHLDVQEWKKAHYGEEPEWHRSVIINTNGKPHELSLTGIVALWLHAEQAVKEYSPGESTIDSPGSNSDVEHTWTITSVSPDTLIYMTFVETSRAGVVELELDRIRVHVGSQVVRRFAIVSVERAIARDEYEHLLHLPAGYGCVPDKPTPNSQQPLTAASVNPLTVALGENGNHYAELEVTATLFPAPSLGLSVQSQTVTVEVARALGSFSATSNRRDEGMLLVRTRHQAMDVKTVVDMFLGVVYSVDQRIGNCSVRRVESGEGLAGATQIHFDSLGVEAGEKSLTLELNTETLSYLFTRTSNYYLINRHQDPFTMESTLQYEARTALPDGRHPARVVRTYRSTPQRPSLELDSATLWLLDERESRLLESYHLRFVLQRYSLPVADLARLFDVADECYLNDGSKRPNRDYAWVQFAYELEKAQLHAVAGHLEQVRQRMYQEMTLFSRVQFFRAPRLELNLDREVGELTARWLLLEGAPLRHLFQREPQMRRRGADVSELASELHDCERACALHDCWLFSYCPRTHECALETGSQSPTPATTFNRDGNHSRMRASLADPFCDIYRRPETLGRGALRELSLSRVLAELQHAHYGRAGPMAALPDVLTRPPAQTGAGSSLIERARQLYLEELDASYKRVGSTKPKPSLAMMLGHVFLSLVPNRFELEQDALLGALNQLDVVPAGDAFYCALEQTRYANHQDDGSSDNSQAQLLFPQLLGSSFDLCELACIDSECDSFSYCQQTRECAMARPLDGHVPEAELPETRARLAKLERAELGCSLMRRNHLSSFSKLGHLVARPRAFKAQLAGLASAADCARSCFQSPQPECLAFVFCDGPASKPSQNTCYLHQSRLVVSMDDALDSPAADSLPADCQRYSRSWLADFVRAEFRALEPSRLASLATVRHMGLGTDQCAELCALAPAGCWAFQFCLDPAHLDGASQTCTLIQRAPGPRDGSELQFRRLSGTDEAAPVRLGTMYVPSDTCHVFAQRPDRGRVSRVAMDERVSGDRERGSDSSAHSGWLVALLTFVVSATLVGAFVATATLLHDRTAASRRTVARARSFGGNI